MPRWPVDLPIRVTPHGKYGYVRKGLSEGTCGVKSYHCTHNAIDLAGSRGTEVYAPEDCSIDSVATGSLPPFRGYGPGVILMRGKVTGVYHLLAHLEPDTIVSPMVDGSIWDFVTTPLYKSDDQRRQVKEGEIVGRIAKNHTHWETRDGAHGARNDPSLWVKRYVTPSLDRSAYSDAGASGGGMGLLLLLGLWAYERRGRRR
jgi:hypothetical protein